MNPNETGPLEDVHGMVAGAKACRRGTCADGQCEDARAYELAPCGSTEMSPAMTRFWVLANKWLLAATGPDSHNAAMDLQEYVDRLVSPCSHRLADVRNPIVQSGYVCIDCGAVFAAADHGMVAGGPSDEREKAPANSLPSWADCAQRVDNSDFIAKRVAEGGYGAEPDDLLASELHCFIYEYDDADPYRSAWFLHRLELLLKEVREQVLSEPPLPAPHEAVAPKLWLWKNFVDGRPEYWAFDNPYPINLTDGDPQTLGQPCGYALFKPSRDGSRGRTEAQVLSEMASVATRATPIPALPVDAVGWMAELERLVDEYGSNCAYMTLRDESNAAQRSRALLLLHASTSPAAGVTGSQQ